MGADPPYEILKGEVTVRAKITGRNIFQKNVDICTTYDNIFI